MNKRVSGFELKLIGIMFMLIDHINTYLGSFLGFPLWISLLGRFVAPLFVFMMVEGFSHTKNKKKYFFRMFIGGLLMHAINISHNLLTKTSFNNPYTEKFDIFLLLSGQNIFMTLAFLFLFIWLLDNLKNKNLANSKKGLTIIGIILLLPLILFSEGGLYELVMVLIFYLFRGDFKKISLSVVSFTLLLLIRTLYGYVTIPDIGSLYQTLTFSNEYMMITVLPFIYAYNGQRGGNGARWQKELFYYFYPAHLLIIYFIQDLLSGVI